MTGEGTLMNKRERLHREPLYSSTEKMLGRSIGEDQVGHVDSMVWPGCCIERGAGPMEQVGRKDAREEGQMYHGQASRQSENLLYPRKVN